MRTRIALVAIAPIAIITIITITVLTQVATVQSARASATPPSGATTTTIAHVSAHRPAGSHRSTTALAPGRSSLLLDLNTGLLARSAKTMATAPPSQAPATTPPPQVASAPAAGPIDTVDPAQRAAWERVANCEEGGNWSAESSRFSGGLGITRANWDNYGGREFASEGATATEDQQIMVAERIQPNPPDRYGCSGW